MTIMLKPEVLAKLLTKGAANACIKMSDEWQYAGTTTFNPNGAYFLSIFFTDFHILKASAPICEVKRIRVSPNSRVTRNQYRLTELGIEVRKILLSKR